MGLDVPIDNRRLPSNLLVDGQVDFMIFSLADYLRSALEQEFSPAQLPVPPAHPLLLNTLEQAGGGGLEHCRGTDELFPVKHIILDGTGGASLQANFQFPTDTLTSQDRIVREFWPFLFRGYLADDVPDVEAVGVLPHETGLVASEALGKSFQAIHTKPGLEVGIPLSNLGNRSSLNLPGASQVSQDELESRIPIKVGVDGLFGLEDGLRDGHGLGHLDSLHIGDRNNFQHARGSGIIAEFIFCRRPLLNEDCQAP